MGSPVVAVDEPALREVAGDAAVFVGEDELVEGVARALEDRERLVAAGLERVEAFSWQHDCGADARGLPGGARMKVSAVVVSHGHARELAESLPALAPQVDELLVVANVPGSVGEVPEGVRVVASPAPRSFAANVNAGVAATSGDYVLVSNPDAVAEPGAIADARRASPTSIRAPGSSARSSSGRTAPGSRRCDASRRARHARRAGRRSASCAGRTSTSTSHYGSKAGPADAGRLAARRRLPAHAPDDAGGARRLGRRLPPLRRGHRPRVPRYAGRLGALARPGRGRATRLRGGDRQAASSAATPSGTPRGMARFVRKHGLAALRGS